MKKLDTTIFDEIGLGKLTEVEKERMLSYVGQTLRNLVGLRLMEQGTPDQLAKFSDLADRGDDEAIMDWLESSFPNFEQIVEYELDNIKKSLADGSQEILKAES